MINWMKGRSVEDRARPGGGRGAILPVLHAVLRNGIGWMSGAGTKQRMELIETLPLGGRRQLMLVLCDGHRYLVGAGSDSIHSIAEIHQHPNAADAAPYAASNAEIGSPR